MLTPDQVRIRLEHLKQRPHEDACWELLVFLEEVLPELVAHTCESSVTKASETPGIGRPDAKVGGLSRYRTSAEMLAEVREEERRVLYGDPDSKQPGLRGVIDA